MRQLVVFTDLDGTLLDATTYSYEAAGEALRVLREQAIPLVLVSSKTRAEMEPLRTALGLDAPFIVENGSAVYIPQRLFPFPISGSTLRGRYLVLEQGAPYVTLRRALKEIERVVGRPLRGFGDMSVDEIADLTGLSPEAAALAKQREYDEPFLVGSSDDVIGTIRLEAESKGLRLTRGGRFCHLTGKVDKGEACQRLIECYRRLNPSGETITLALGDGPNDLPMLAVVDHPVALQRPDGTYDPLLESPRVSRAPAPGPAGWNRAVLEILHRLRASA